MSLRPQARYTVETQSVVGGGVVPIMWASSVLGDKRKENTPRNRRRGVFRLEPGLLEHAIRARSLPTTLLERDGRDG